MLGLKLRDEFLGTYMPGTAISLTTSDNQGAAQKSADYILAITYPTADVQTALKAISTRRSGCPIILMGDRGRGKSHIMAVMHHAIQSPEVVESWLADWGTITSSDELKSYEIEKRYFPISEPVHNHEYFFLWDLLFDRHPKGQYFRGQFENMDNPFPPRTLMERMFKENPTCLILDEFQTWYTGLPDKDPKTGFLLKNYAFNFIQILSEIAKDMPEILIFVISVLNNQNDAFQQVHRQGPVVIDFRGPSAKQDRQKLLLHRLFENRRNINDSEIIGISGVYANERFRLLHANKSESEKGRIQLETLSCWPYSPELLDLLEEHILLSSAAQETRDMIRILAQVYKSRGDMVPVITSADFFVDGESEEVQTLVDSISVQAGQEKLRQIAQRNLESIRDANINIPNARELISTIWMRSLTPGRTAGGIPAELHLDITRDKVIDDNAFQLELALLIENSINIHGDEVQGGPLWIGVTENPRSKVRACARNDKQWNISAVPIAGMPVYPGKDISHIRNTLKHILVPETTQSPSRVIILGQNWKDNPWNDTEDIDNPSKWDRPILLVIPDHIEGEKQGINTCLGTWLAEHVPYRRNTIRFMLPASDTEGIYSDKELSYSARCSYLCSPECWGTDLIYRNLWRDFDRSMREVLKSRFNRMAVLRRWDFQQPQNCVFEIEKISELGGQLPMAVEVKILNDLFDSNDFCNFILKCAKDSDFVGAIIDNLIEPPPTNTIDAIPFLGEIKIYEQILSIVANGDIVLNVNGTWIGRRTEDLSIEDALRFIKSNAFCTGQEMRQIQLGLPNMVGGGTVTAGGPPKKTDLPRPGTDEAGKPNGGGPAYPPTKPIISGPDDVADNEEKSNGTLKNNKTDEPTPIGNLASYFEVWGIPANQSIDAVRIGFTGLTVQQIKLILARIPSTFKATMDIDYKEGGHE